MAAPVITSIAALIKAVKPDATPDEIEEILESSAAPLASDALYEE